MFVKNKQFNFFILFSLSLFLWAISVKAIGGSNLKLAIIPAPQCADGLDNDGDSLIDYPNDPDCVSPNDNREAADFVSNPSVGGNGGGGEQGLVIIPTSAVSFSGKAYPSTVVKLLRDGEIVASTISGSDASFKISFQELTPGNHLFSIYSEDSSQHVSVTLPFNIYIAQGAIIQLTSIFVPPTSNINKSNFLPGEVINIFGQTIPESQISITIHSTNEINFKTDANKNGLYSYSFDSALLAVGSHEAKVRSSKNGEVSDYSSTLNFQVGDKSKIPEIPVKIPVNKTGSCKKTADFNADHKVNLVDFSIAAFWYKKLVSSDAAAKVDLNCDGKINLIDFSILAYYWTG